MTFKAKIASEDLISSNTGNFRKYTSPFYYTFTKTKIKFPKEIKEQSHTFIKPENRFYNNENYSIIELDRYDVRRTEDSKFQAKMSSGLAFNLVTDKRNELKLKFIHKLLWVQKHGEWFIKALIVGLISLAVYTLGRIILK